MRMILNETSYFGAGCRDQLTVELNRRGYKKAFVVTDKDLVKFGVAKFVTDELDKAQVFPSSSLTTLRLIPRLTTLKTVLLSSKRTART